MEYNGLRRGDFVWHDIYGKGLVITFKDGGNVGVDFNEPVSNEFPDNYFVYVSCHELRKDNEPRCNEKLFDNIEWHNNITYELSETYARKNADYGDSFGKSIREHGIIAAIVRLEDKMNRITSLVKSDDIKVKSESMDDTLMDMANYAIMTVIEIRKGAIE